MPIIVVNGLAVRKFKERDEGGISDKFTPYITQLKSFQKGRKSVPAYIVRTAQQTPQLVPVEPRLLARSVYPTASTTAGMAGVREEGFSTRVSRVRLKHDKI